MRASKWGSVSKEGTTAVDDGNGPSTVVEVVLSYQLLLLVVVAAFVVVVVLVVEVEVVLDEAIILLPTLVDSKMMNSVHHFVSCVASPRRSTPAAAVVVLRLLHVRMLLNIGPAGRGRGVGCCVSSDVPGFRLHCVAYLRNERFPLLLLPRAPRHGEEVWFVFVGREYSGKSRLWGKALNGSRN